MTYLDDFLKHDPKTIKKNIKKLTPINYNKFYWWRNFKENDPLHSSKKKRLIDEIKNGDYEYSSFYWQAQYAILKGIEKIQNIKNPDIQVEKSSIDLERYRKLMIDFEKEENKRLITLYKKLSKHFKLSLTDINIYIESFDGTVEDFYYFLTKKTGII